jgi:hypothetical protein
MNIFVYMHRGGGGGWVGIYIYIYIYVYIHVCVCVTNECPLSHIRLTWVGEDHAGEGWSRGGGVGGGKVAKDTRQPRGAGELHVTGDTPYRHRHLTGFFTEGCACDAQSSAAHHTAHRGVHGLHTCTATQHRRAANNSTQHYNRGRTSNK